MKVPGQTELLLAASSQRQRGQPWSAQWSTAPGAVEVGSECLSGTIPDWPAPTSGDSQGTERGTDQWAWP